MPPKILRVALAALLLIGAAAPAHAFRCGSRIITRGDHADKILHYCGEPVAVHTWWKQRPYFTHGVQLRGAVEEVLVEEWTFNFGPRQLMRVVRLEDGWVEEIKHLGYGY